MRRIVLDTPEDTEEITSGDLARLRSEMIDNFAAYWQEGSGEGSIQIFENNQIQSTLMIEPGIELDRLILGVVETYDPYGETEIHACQWEQICAEAERTGGSLLEAVRELSPWAEENFRQNSVFTILGI